ncbi:MAG: hypothetical protein Q8S44_09435 [Flavobacteriaceae bacterium]|nr:hypothetical protein [Flavobacteriaceae bacterium]
MLTIRNVLVVLILTTIFGCNQTPQNSLTYFGGQIINPKGNYVYLEKNGKTVDSTLLDDNHKFLMKFNLENEGLFYFKHGNEFQYLYLQPNDSVLVRLNTWDFDESIVFSGKGAEKNNLLINLFIINELEDENFYPFYQLDSKTFSKKIDSAISSKEKLLFKFKKSNQNISEGFLNLANANIYLPTFRKKENYAYGHKKLLNLPNFTLNDNQFYKYRKKINLNDTTLIQHHSYQNYLNSLIYNKTSLIKDKDSLNQNFSLIALKLIDEQFNNNAIKNLLLKQTIMESFLKDSNCKFEEDELGYYNKKSSNKDDLRRISKLYDDSNSLTNNELFKDFVIIDHQNRLKYINSLILNRNTVIYFWSPDSMSEEYLISRINFLETHYPSILFIGINTNSSQASINKTMRLPLKNQFFLPDNSFGKKHISSNFPRTILINSNGIVENSFTFLASKHFNHLIVDLEKK